MHTQISTQNFACVIGDNAEADDHRAGYNGVWSLIPSGKSSSLFVPGVAGLNLEHYFDGWSNATREIRFEPRQVPMTMEQPAENVIRLTQAETPIWGVESVTTFTVREPDVIDMEFECTPRRQVFRNRTLGVFWASYIHAPEDNAIRFLGRRPRQRNDAWQALASPAHGVASSVRGPDDDFALEIGPEAEGALYSDLAPPRWSEPWYYGRWQDWAYVVAIRTERLLRFSMSPTGGGEGNAAWDFHMLAPEMRIGETYRLAARCIVTPWRDVDYLAARARAWLRF